MDKNEQFIEACKRDDIYNAIILMRDPDVDVNYRDIHGITPLFYAVFNGYIDIVRRLLNHPDIKINLKSNDTSALRVASENGNIELVKLLLANGADIDFNVDVFFPNTPEIVEIKSILKRWPLSMAVLGLQENAVYHHLDTNEIKSLHEFNSGGRKRNKKSNKRRKTYRKKNKRKTFKRK
jgi:ankyrin repeat protein